MFYAFRAKREKKVMHFLNILFSFDQTLKKTLVQGFNAVMDHNACRARCDELYPTPSAGSIALRCRGTIVFKPAVSRGCRVLAGLPAAARPLPHCLAAEEFEQPDDDIQPEAGDEGDQSRTVRQPKPAGAWGWPCCVQRATLGMRGSYIM